MQENSMARENIKEVVPFLRVSNMEQSVRYYVDGLGFTMKLRWENGGRLCWCCLTLGAASIMLQEFATEGHAVKTPEGKLGEGVSLVFMCKDAVAVYREALSRGIEASEPQVGNAMWVTCLSDPDGYRLEFESATDTPEETKLSDVTH